MVERFLSQTSFVSQEDYRKNLHIRVPENFNFGYDVVDAYAAEQPGKEALLWTDDQGAEIRFTFADIKRESDRTASYFQSLGIGKGDVVMLILKRRYEFWFSILALHKLGAVVIPATHLLTKKDVVYRCNTAGIKAIVAAGERVITDHIAAAMPESPTTELLVSVGPEVPEGFLDFHAGIEKAAPFVRPERVNANDDVMMMYFTSGTTGEPKMVAHDFTYPLGHITTGLLWHNLHEGSLHLTIADTGWAKAAWGKLYGQWLAGACLFVYDHEKFTPADMLRKIEQYRITSLCAPPTVYRFLIREDLTKYDLSSLEYCTTAGEALNGAVYDTFLRLTGIRLMEGFGQTETTLTLATFPWMKSKPGSMGVPNPQYRIDLVTPDGRSAADGEQGRCEGRYACGEEEKPPADGSRRKGIDRMPEGRDRVREEFKEKVDTAEAQQAGGQRNAGTGDASEYPGEEDEMEEKPSSAIPKKAKFGSMNTGFPSLQRTKSAISAKTAAAASCSNSSRTVTVIFACAIFVRETGRMRVNSSSRVPRARLK